MSDPLQFFIDTTACTRPQMEPRPAPSTESFATVFNKEMKTDVLGEEPAQPMVPAAPHKERILYPMPGHPLVPHGTSYHPPPS